MNRTEILSVIFAGTILLCQMIIIDGYDVGDLFRATTTLFGIVCLFILSLKKDRINSIDYLVFTPLIWIIGRTLLDWAPGYSIFIIVQMFAMVGLIIAISKLQVIWIYRALMLSVFLQSAVTYLNIIDWRVPIYDDGEHVSIFGTVRHAIRYSTIIFVGLIAAAKLIDVDYRGWKYVSMGSVLVGIPTLFHAFSNIIIFLCALSVLAIVASKLGVKVALGCVLILSLITIFTQPKGFSIDKPRIESWKRTTHEIMKSPQSIAFGHGAGAWNLHANSFKSHGGHPHNEAINIVYEYGLVGLFIFIGVFALFVFFSMIDLYAFLLLVGVNLSFLTNSMRYPDMLFFWAIVMGLALAQVKTPIME